MKLNLDYLVECIWDHLDLIRVITKKPGCAPDFDDAIVLRNGVTVKHVCHAIHRSIPELLKYALVWVINCFSIKHFIKITSKFFPKKPVHVHSLSFIYFAGNKHKI